MKLRGKKRNPKVSRQEQTSRDAPAPRSHLGILRPNEQACLAHRLPDVGGSREVFLDRSFPGFRRHPMG